MSSFQSQISDSVAYPGKFWLAIALTGSVSLLIYGSLVPFHFESMQFADAKYIFLNLLDADVDIQSRVDFSSNVLLTAPISFSLAGILWRSKTSFFAALTICFISILLTFFLTVAVEFLQIYLPERKTAKSDIVAQGLGSILGIILWIFGGRSFWARLFTSELGGPKFTRHQSLFYLYLIATFGYNILPLDITMNPADLYQKWQSGRFIIVPFSYPYAGIFNAAYELTTDAILWVPVTLYCLKIKRLSFIQSWVITSTLALALETLQVFVYTRIADATDVLTAAIASGITILGYRLIAERYENLKPGGSKFSATQARIISGLWLFVSWNAILAAIFWFPYDLELDGTSIRAKLKGLSDTPFYSYYRNSPFMAVTSAARKILLFSPIGVFSWLFVSPSKKYLHWTLYFSVVLALCLGSAAVIELGQLLVKFKVVTGTDIFLKLLGALLGFFVMSRLYKNRISWTKRKHLE